ncbi:hypothetical protein K438DRAFT_1765280 [Mycena galopus ATCC 62051]|nr:hypothetical protein K438DRAFT_1765280 [Mycena galopus ATCC 62051]
MPLGIRVPEPVAVEDLLEFQGEAEADWMMAMDCPEAVEVAMMAVMSESEALEPRSLVEAKWHADWLLWEREVLSVLSTTSTNNKFLQKEPPISIMSRVRKKGIFGGGGKNVTVHDLMTFGRGELNPVRTGSWHKLWPSHRAFPTVKIIGEYSSTEQPTKGCKAKETTDNVTTKYVASLIGNVVGMQPGTDAGAYVGITRSRLVLFLGKGNKMLSSRIAVHRY